MRILADILLVALGCSLVLGRPNDGINLSGLPVTLRSSLSLNFDKVKDGVEDESSGIFEPVKGGPHDDATDALKFFKDTIADGNLGVGNPVRDAAAFGMGSVSAEDINYVVFKATDNMLDGVIDVLKAFVDIVADVQLAVIKPVIDAVETVKDRIEDIHASVVKPVVNVVFGEVIGALEVLTETLKTKNVSDINAGFKSQTNFPTVCTRARMTGRIICSREMFNMLVSRVDPVSDSAKEGDETAVE